MAAPISVQVGDADGFGFGAPNNGTGVVWPGLGPSGSGFDGRSVAESGATNGAHITDVYSALYPTFGPNSSETGSVLLPFAGLLNSGTVTIATGDFQASEFTAINANINGVALPFGFQDGFQVTSVKVFPLSPAEIAAANLAGQVILNFNHAGSVDFIAFDFFRLDGDATLEPVPEPATLLLFGSTMMGLGALNRWRRRAQS
jgi:hypothetical protein